MSRRFQPTLVLVLVAIVNLVAGTAGSAEPGLDLLGVASSTTSQAGEVPVRIVPATDTTPAARPAPAATQSRTSKAPQAEAVTMLSRIIAAEAGGDYYSPLVTKMAVGGAVVNHIRKGYGLRRIDLAAIKLLLRSEPNYLSSLSDGNRYLFGKNAAWLKANGFADCLTAARRVLAGEDPSHGGTNWYDTSISQPYSSRTITITARL